MKSTYGRPRALTDAQVDEILTWHRSRKSLLQLARELGVRPETIRRAIRCGGRYKRRPPAPSSADEGSAPAVNRVSSGKA